MAELWAVYRRDDLGNKVMLGLTGVWELGSGETVKVWGLMSEAEAREVARRINESHIHPHKEDYFPVKYEAGKMYETFVKENIQIL